MINISQVTENQYFENTLKFINNESLIVLILSIICVKLIIGQKITIIHNFDSNNYKIFNLCVIDKKIIKLLSEGEEMKSTEIIKELGINMMKKEFNRKYLYPLERLELIYENNQYWSINE